MGSTTTTVTTAKRKRHVVAETPTIIMPARKAKSQSRSPAELASLVSAAHGRKRLKTSVDSAKAKKCRTAQE
ncbi:hypothetical protein PITC_049480 [Penicillium italicum]|uniref:Uncharacterized protein n=1 Tax=Penicillium italicum TaxID=40296 RepID=A0A0A2K9K5_PENIT|nr:hypothetical protein PITC_049480 [Penicillium italicum]